MTKEFKLSTLLELIGLSVGLGFFVAILSITVWLGEELNEILPAEVIWMSMLVVIILVLSISYSVHNFVIAKSHQK